MIKTLFGGLVLLVTFAAPAAAGLPSPGPNIDGGVLGLVLATAVMFLIYRRGRRQP